jgi:hypothetical protein
MQATCHKTDTGTCSMAVGQRNRRGGRAVGSVWQEDGMKNPFMSMWLSAENKAAGTARGMWMAEARRQQTAAAKEMTKDAGLGTGSTRQKAAPKRRRK